VFAVRCAGCKQRYWCAVCVLGLKRTPCTKTLTWFVNRLREGCEIVSEGLPILCVFCSLYHCSSGYLFVSPCVVKKVKQSRYRPGVAKRVPGS
jgi:hypothetical protein